MSKHPHRNTGSGESVHSITDAREAHTDEMRTRMIKYSVSMAIRVVCLILVFVVDGWLQWVFVAGAVFLPYFAVIIANGGSDTSKLQHSSSLLDAPPAREIEGPERQDPAADESEAADGVVRGEVVDEDVQSESEPHAESKSEPETPHSKKHGYRQEHRHTS